MYTDARRAGWKPPLRNGVLGCGFLSGSGVSCSGFFGGGFGLRVAVPVEGDLEALLEASLRFVAEEFAGLRNVRLRVADVAVARRIVLGFERFASNLAQRCQDLIQRNA